MLIILSALFPDTSWPFWPHVGLLSVSVLAAFAVGAGIIYESSEYSAAIHRVAKWLVLEGIAIESLCTILLFVLDEGISSTQQSKIIVLEERLASRSLTSAQQADIAEKVRAFSGVPYDFSVQPGAEPLALMEQIATSLKTAGWSRQPWQGSSIVFTLPGQPAAGMVAFAGLEIQIHASKSIEWGFAVKALWDALAATGLKTTALIITDNSELPNAIHIKIGTKP